MVTSHSVHLASLSAPSFCAIATLRRKEQDAPWTGSPGSRVHATWPRQGVEGLWHSAACRAGRLVQRPPLRAGHPRATRSLRPVRALSPLRERHCHSEHRKWTLASRYPLPSSIVGLDLPLAIYFQRSRNVHTT